MELKRAISPYIRGVIFDFNGTLFRDAAFHDAAWSAFGESHNVTLAPNDLEQHVLGFTNKEILTYLFNRSLPEEDQDRFSREKESLYRELCREDSVHCVLAPGAVDFLGYLEQTAVRRSIATASIRENVAFFFDTFSLHRWFVFDQIAYDDGQLRGKPFPDMFLAAAESIGVPISDCMIIEDSRSGIEGAKRAGAGYIAAISPKEAHSKFGGIEGIDQIVCDFREIEKGVFIKG